MKVPPKRKGNYKVLEGSTMTYRVNESPSEKEGKYLAYRVHEV